MANVLVDETALQNIADAIRTKNGTQNTYKPGQMADAIEAIPSGGITPTGTVNINTNGTTDVTQYASANVAVPNSYAAADEGKVVSNGALVAQTSKNISANGTVDTTLNNQVVVAVPNSYSASDEGKVVSNGALVAQGSDTVTANDTYDTTLINSLTVNVSGSGGGAILDTYRAVVGRTLSGRFEDSSLTQIGESGFRSCTGITSVFLNGITSDYGNNAFYGCTGIQTAVLANTNALATQTFNNCSNLESLDTNATSIGSACFSGASKLNKLVLRKSSAICSLSNASAFNNTPFKSGGTGGTIYIPKALYDHLGDGGSFDYKAATNWSTINGYGTITWAKIEGSAYENAYVDGTPIT